LPVGAGVFPGAGALPIGVFPGTRGLIPPPSGFIVAILSSGAFFVPLLVRYL
jgi:hypothetical protein